MCYFLSAKNRGFSLILGFFLLFIPFIASYAAAGCCSHHKGVAGCDQASNHASCKDGTVSPTCLCNGGKTSKTATTTSKTTTQNGGASTSTTTSTTTPAATTTTSSATTSTKGCCSRHGGVARCDKTAGYQVCKDGTTSTTCKCQ